MKHIERWQKFKERALSRRKPLTRGKRVSQGQHNEILLLHIVEFLEHEVLPTYGDSAKAVLLVQEIHDWKERLRGN